MPRTPPSPEPAPEPLMSAYAFAARVDDRAIRDVITTLHGAEKKTLKDWTAFAEGLGVTPTGGTE